MKQVLTFLTLLFCVTLFHAQPNKPVEVPDAIINRFTLLYPDGKNILWQRTSEIYVAEFKNNKMATTAVFTGDGALVKTETEIKITALPEVTTAYLTKTFEPKKVENARIIEDESGIITFKALIDKVDYTFDGNGLFIAADQIVIGIK